MKNVERRDRSTGNLKPQNIIPNHAIEQWDSFLSSELNEKIPIEFIVDQWMIVSNLNLIGRKLF
jgi:hypothetical protein